MVDEQHLEHALPRVERFVGVNADDLTFNDRRGAGGGQLGSLLDFDQTHATDAGDGQTRMVAVVRNQDSRGLRRLENRRPFRDCNRPAFDRDIHHLLLGHYATAAVTG